MTPENRRDLDKLFPAPINRCYYLWAHGWEECGKGCWSHPGHTLEQAEYERDPPGFLTTEAVSQTWGLDVWYLTSERSSDRRILWEMAARYQWLVTFGETRDPANSDDIHAWFQERNPWTE